MADNTEKKTLVDEGTEFRGTLSSKCPVIVKGAVDGELRAPALRVSESGSVSGKVHVTELASEGQLAGEFDADVVRLSGLVKDSTIIRARTLEVQADGKGKVTFGEATLEVGDMPAPEATQAASPSGGRARRNRE